MLYWLVTIPQVYHSYENGDYFFVHLLSKSLNRARSSA